MRLNANELIAAARVTVPTLPPEAAKLMSDMADRLDVQYAVIRESQAQLHAVVAENAALKSAIEFAEPWFPSCDDELLHRIEMAKETKSTDAAIAALRAEGVEMFAEHALTRHGELLTAPNDYATNQAITATRRAGEFALQFARQLRQSVQVKGVQS